MMKASKFDDASNHLTRALEVVKATGDAMNEFKLLYNLGICELRTNRLSEALGFFERALQLSMKEASVVGEQVGQLFLALAFVMHEQGLYAEAADRFKQGLELVGDGNQELAFLGHTCLGICYQVRPWWDRSEERCGIADGLRRSVL
jgi:tetratricopeptide (TPR) repeat protein